MVAGAISWQQNHSAFAIRSVDCVCHSVRIDCTASRNEHHTMCLSGSYKTGSPCAHLYEPYFLFSETVGMKSKLGGPFSIVFKPEGTNGAGNIVDLD